MPGPLRRLPPCARPAVRQRVDIDGGGVEAPLDRDPITGPLGVVLCGAGGGVVVGLGGEVGCGWLGAGVFEAEDEAEELGVTCASLMEPSLGRSAEVLPVLPPCASGAPVGRSVSEGRDAPVAPDETEALLVSCAGDWLTVLLQAAQTRAATTAVAAALAGATVPRIGMEPTVAK